MSAKGLPGGLDELNRRLAGLDGSRLSDLSDGIAYVYEAIASTPAALLQDFDAFTENHLDDHEGRLAAQIARGPIRLAGGPTPVDTLLEAARLLRALEQVALQFDRAIESDRGPDLEDALRVSDGRHYVIRRTRSIIGLNGKPFLKRALLHHRVIPTRLKEHFLVRLHRSPRIADASAAARRAGNEARQFGAAFFPALRANLSPGSGDFVVESLEGFDAETMIKAQLEAARKDRCSAIVWAELTMPSGSVAQVREALAACALDEDPSCDFVVVGSWHERDGDLVRNISPVLDGGGQKLFDIVKWAKFKIGGRIEGIAPGDEIPILINDDELIVMAICRDFLQDTEEPPYCALDVDLAIVPSMSPAIDDPKTIWSHAATAQTMRIRFGTRTLVVIQPAMPSDNGATGQLLPFPLDPQKDRDGIIVSGSWHSCPLENL